MIESTVKVSPSFESAATAKLVQTANMFKSHVSLVFEEKTANAKSIMGIISLELSDGNDIKIVADGEDEMQAVPEIEKILGENSHG
ncbi:MAG: HPr family phosphocarrier protein [Defluviitaleaceae bacterium]|nr:HPr family phosphocarrier protein [Defluviitaleaceae bacterium]